MPARALLHATGNTSVRGNTRRRKAGERS